ncbi:MAG: SDR family oxidoreductase [Deltaproteobacteria bacterium]|nr:SDR family oxidoreductase [Deltaproteobacteria bacterium]
MSFLGFDGKTFAIFGVSNRKSVGYVTGQILAAEGARVLYVVHTEARRASLAKRLPAEDIYVADVEQGDDIARVKDAITRTHPMLHGFVHSIAFANYEGGFRTFHETPRAHFLQAMQISCHSFIELANAFKDNLHPEGAVVTISISTTKMAAENYGYMAPIKAALDSSVVFLAKSFAGFSNIRFNAVAPGLLKTSSSAGIPGYVDSYLFAEEVIPRKRGVSTQEVANTVAFLLSERSGGINGQNVVIDAGMSFNYFARDVVQAVTRRNSSGQ